MRLTLEHRVVLILGVLSTAPTIAHAQGAAASWLDQPRIASWNTPGQAIPAAPRPDDGMCRPLQYQDFVFVGGVFAGTLAPAPMDTRTDGAINRVSLTSATQLTAEYARYGKSDALCCPSRTTRVNFDIAADPPAVRAASAATAQAGGGRP